MRRALNENPAVQVILVGVLVIVAGFLFMTRIAGQGNEEASPTATTPAASEASSTGIPASSVPATTGDAATGSVPAAGASTTAPSSAAAAPVSGFEAGPGLPKAVAGAHEHGDVVVLLVLRKGGIDDAKLARSIDAARESGRTALFVTETKHVARYSRIARGVDLDRAPALVVVEPRSRAQGGLPEASVSYGYRAAQSIRQAVRDVLYKGPENLPYHPG